MRPVFAQLQGEWSQKDSPLERHGRFYHGVQASGCDDISCVNKAVEIDGMLLQVALNVAFVCGGKERDDE